MGCQENREWEGEDVEARSSWPLPSISTHEKRQRGKSVREMVHNTCCFVVYYYMRVRDNSVLFDSHLLALCHSSSVKFSLNETCLNKALKRVLYLKVSEKEVSSLLKHIEALLRAIF